MNSAVKKRIRESLACGLTTILLVKAVEYVLDGVPPQRHLITGLACAILLAVASYYLDILYSEEKLKVRGPK